MDFRNSFNVYGPFRTGVTRSEPTTRASMYVDEGVVSEFGSVYCVSGRTERPWYSYMCPDARQPWDHPVISDVMYRMSRLFFLWKFLNDHSNLKSSNMECWYNEKQRTFVVYFGTHRVLCEGRMLDSRRNFPLSVVCWVTQSEGSRPEHLEHSRVWEHVTMSYDLLCGMLVGLYFRAFSIHRSSYVEAQESKGYTYIKLLHKKNGAVICDCVLKVPNAQYVIAQPEINSYLEYSAMTQYQIAHFTKRSE